MTNSPRESESHLKLMRENRRSWRLEGEMLSGSAHIKEQTQKPRGEGEGDSRLVETVSARREYKKAGR